MKDIDNRESYEIEELEERNTTLEARESLIQNHKKWPTELWTKVIERAIEDAAHAKGLRDSNKKLSFDAQENESSALSFLFDPKHKIPFDDYVVEITCPKCKHVWHKPMSEASASKSKCKCKYKISTKYIDSKITNKIVKKEISLEELVSLWGVDDIEGFRDGCWRRIEEQSKQKGKKYKKNITEHLNSKEIDEADNHIKNITTKIKNYLETLSIEELKLMEENIEKLLRSI